MYEIRQRDELPLIGKGWPSLSNRSPRIIISCKIQVISSFPFIHNGRDPLMNPAVTEALPIDIRFWRLLFITHSFSYPLHVDIRVQNPRIYPSIEFAL